jgi:hypothetical protein
MQFGGKADRSGRLSEDFSRDIEFALWGVGYAF